MDSFAAQYYFLEARSLQGLQGLSSLQELDDGAANSIFATLCLLCSPDEGNANALDTILLFLKDQSNQNVTCPLDYGQVLEFYYDLISQSKKMAISGNASDLFRDLIADLSVRQLNLSPEATSWYTAFLLKTLNEYHQQFSETSNSVSSPVSKAAKTSASSKRVFKFSVTKKSGGGLLLCILLLGFIGIELFRIQPTSQIVSSETAPSDNILSFSLPARPSENASYESYLDYYQEVQRSIAEQNEEFVDEKYQERLENADTPVYIQEGDSCYHLSPDCSNLSSSPKVVSCTLEEARQAGHPYPCPDCAK